MEEFLLYTSGKSLKTNYSAQLEFLFYSVSYKVVFTLAYPEEQCVVSAVIFLLTESLLHLVVQVVRSPISTNPG